MTSIELEQRENSCNSAPNLLPSASKMHTVAAVLKWIHWGISPKSKATIYELIRRFRLFLSWHNPCAFYLRKGQCFIRRMLWKAKQTLTALLVAGSIGVGANALFAQNFPGPNVPKPGPDFEPTLTNKFRTTKSWFLKRNHFQDNEELSPSAWRHHLMPPVSRKW